MMISITIIGDLNGLLTTEGKGDGLAWHDNYSQEENEFVRGSYPTIDTDDWENNQTGVAKKSLEKYKGFYVARFEAGIPSTASFYTNGEGNYIVDGRNNTELIKSYKPISQKGMKAWNFISPVNAKVVSENMYKDGSKGVKSYLIDNTAWNVICNKFGKILSKNKNGMSLKDMSQLGNYYNNSTTRYQELDAIWALWLSNGFDGIYRKGNITESDMERGDERGHIELETGASDDFKIYNIFDMAGNLGEWSSTHNMTSGDIFVLVQGGTFIYKGSDRTVTNVTAHDQIRTSLYDVGFRVILYIE